jgi:hypothetical protein
MLSKELNNTVAKAKSIFGDIPQNCLNAIFSPFAIDAILSMSALTKQGDVKPDEIEIKKDCKGIHSLWQNSKGWLLIYVNDKNPPDAIFQKIRSALGRKNLLDTVKLKSHTYENGWFEKQFDISTPNMFIIFHNGHFVYRSDYSAIVHTLFGKRAEKHSLELSSISDKDLDSIFDDLYHEDLPYSHKRIIESYSIHFVLLQKFSSKIEDSFFKNYADFFVHQFKHTYAFSLNEHGAFNTAYQAPSLLHSLMKVGEKYGVPQLFQGKLPLEEWPNILLLRVFKQMRLDIENKIQIHNQLLKRTIYRAFIAATKRDSLSMISQVTFLEYCYLLTYTSNLLQGCKNKEQISPQKMTMLRQQWAFFSKSDLDHFKLSTTSLVEPEKHAFLPELKLSLNELAIMLGFSAAVKPVKSVKSSAFGLWTHHE